MPYFVYAFVLMLNADFVLTIYSNCEYYFAQQEIKLNWLYSFKWFAIAPTYEAASFSSFKWFGLF